MYAAATVATRARAVIPTERVAQEAVATLAGAEVPSAFGMAVTEAR